MIAQQQLLAKYGPPDHDYVQKWCVVWYVQSEYPWFPAHSFLVNKDFRAKLRQAFSQLQTKGLHTEIRTFDGCYNDRNVRGSDTTSLHSWAVACDLNAEDNPMTESEDPTLRHGKWSPAFIQTMKETGLFFGGDFHHRADPMHWGLVNG